MILTAVVVVLPFQPARATMRGEYKVNVLYAPELTVTYEDDNSRTPPELDRSYVLTEVRNVQVHFVYSLDVLLNSSNGQAPGCTDTDINHLVTVTMSGSSSASITLRYERWDLLTGAWQAHSESLFDSSRYDLGIDPYAASVTLCGGEAAVSAEPTSSPDPTPTPSETTASPSPSETTVSPSPTETATQSTETPTPSRSVTLDASDYEVERGSNATLFGSLSGPEGCSLGAQVNVQACHGGGKRYKTVATATTDTSGTYAVSLPIRSSVSFLARAPAIGGCAEVTSQQIFVEAS